VTRWLEITESIFGAVVVWLLIGLEPTPWPVVWAFLCLEVVRAIMRSEIGARGWDEVERIGERHGLKRKMLESLPDFRMRLLRRLGGET
jgi:hypothetical protein